MSQESQKCQRTKCGRCLCHHRPQRQQILTRILTIYQLTHPIQQPQRNLSQKVPQLIPPHNKRIHIIITQIIKRSIILPKADGEPNILLQLHDAAMWQVELGSEVRLKERCIPVDTLAQLALIWGYAAWDGAQELQFGGCGGEEGPCFKRPDEVEEVRGCEDHALGAYHRVTRHETWQQVPDCGQVAQSWGILTNWHTGDGALYSCLAESQDEEDDADLWSFAEAVGQGGAVVTWRIEGVDDCIPNVYAGEGANVC